MQKQALKVAIIKVSRKKFHPILWASLMALILTAPLSKSQAAKAPISQSQINQAERILKQRGFNKYAIVALLHGHIFTLTHRINENTPFKQRMNLIRQAENWVEALRKKHGVESPSVILYTRYEPDTGRNLEPLNLLDFARTITLCMANNRPWRDCTLNYHPIDGCFLNQQQRRQCVAAGKGWARYQSTGEWGNLNPEICWNYAKGPGIILPYQAKVKSQINLAKAVRLERQQVAQSLKKQAPINQQTLPAEKSLKDPRTHNFLARPGCQSALSRGPSCLHSKEGC